MNMPETVKDKPQKRPKHVTIHIDKQTFKVEGERGPQFVGHVLW